MISFGLLGVGKFGSRVRRVLQDESIIDLHWVADSRSVAAELSSVDWVQQYYSFNKSNVSKS